MIYRAILHLTVIVDRQGGGEVLVEQECVNSQQIQWENYCQLTALVHIPLSLFLFLTLHLSLCFQRGQACCRRSALSPHQTPCGGVSGEISSVHLQQFTQVCALERKRIGFATIPFLVLQDTKGGFITQASASVIS